MLLSMTMTLGSSNSPFQTINYHNTTK